MNFSSELLNKGNKTPAFSISIEGNGFTTSLELEVKINDFEME